ncbi:SPW repeat protein [Mesorhizobium newzealandense]|uniref:SPW repeat protein n=1 Tax=Mesorhizobium newzealandense TaxID=1300302 RepID=A0ABW4U950_9HYPH
MFAGLPLAVWNAGIVGALIVCCSAVALYRYGAWTEWSNLTLGCWAVVAPFLLGFGSAQGPMWTHVMIGLCVATIAAMQLIASRKSAGALKH